MKLSIGRRKRRRVRSSGRVDIKMEYVIDFKDPFTKRRRQLFFHSQVAAIEARERLLEDLKRIPNVRAMTITHAYEHWLRHRQIDVKPVTFSNYAKHRKYVVGPLFMGSPRERRLYARGLLQRGTLMPMLGECLIAELTTGEIRAWHRQLVENAGYHTANVAKKILRACLQLAAEDFNFRIPAMPSRQGRGYQRPKKKVLSFDQVQKIVAAAQEGDVKAAYAAFPFLTGVRPSEQLGLAWRDVDFSDMTIRIERMQEIDGSISEVTKTVAGTRLIPMCRTLHEILLRLRSHFTGADPGDQVFACIGTRGRRHQRGGRLFYNNFRLSYWQPTLRKLELPLVTPHSARHWFISALQARKVELALVAQLAGHADLSVTLDHYTHAMRGGHDAVRELDAILEGQGGAVQPSRQPPT